MSGEDRWVTEKIYYYNILNQNTWLIVREVGYRKE